MSLAFLLYPAHLSAMKTLLTRLMDRSPDSSTVTDPGMAIQPVFDPPQPATHLYAIGDIHGRADLVEPLLEIIDDHIDQHAADDAHVVFLGDYIDRGPRSAEVLAILRKLTKLYRDRAICLMGNHERMMLDFLDDPEKGSFWLRNGGVATVESFGVTGASVRVAESADALSRLHRDLHTALPDGLEDWLRNLRLSWQNGEVWAVHAGADPDMPLSRQTSRVLLWGHGGFAERVRHDGVWVVHGHTVVPEPLAELGRISVDTGAFLTGRLTAAAIGPSGDIEFLSATANDQR